ncbi:AAA family ATPase [Mycolicibacterium psychrotolerans]|uniref:AAA family ATPase n=1 Tax=Mycolicibacterium psychrotolerans TaxID=216929 RepID=A0A7I7MCB4_9MYCO|nr:AAA family ATPase [Mycolicibacterium psychrotolerans]BBX69019.1 hypothetical protein MPSYJ_24800 [Mycolicibacterium psychrotolerans]
MSDLNGFHFDAITLSNVKPERVEWLWPHHLPRGKVVTLDGDPGVGKSTLALSFASTVTNGGRWPDGTGCPIVGDVILMSAEDGLADTIVPRLIAADADTTRVHAVRGVPLPGEHGDLRMAVLTDIGAMRDLIEDTGAVLLVVDVLMAYLPSGTDSHRDQDVRRILAPLARLADETGCTILLLRHLNKGKGDPLYRGGGSIGIVGASRVGMVVAPHPDDENVRVLATVKNNLAAIAPAMTYRLVSTEGGVARVEWMGESDHSARDLLDATDEGDTPHAAQEWLHDYLQQEGRAPSAEVKVAARKAGFSERTIKRVASKLGVAAESYGFPRRTHWSLPQSNTQSGHQPTAPIGLGPTGPTGPAGSDQDERGEPIGPTAQSGQRMSTGPTGTPTARSGHSVSPIQGNATDRPEDNFGPPCSVCGKPVVAAQGDTHISCRRVVIARNKAALDAPQEDTA